MDQIFGGNAFNLVRFHQSISTDGEGI